MGSDVADDDKDDNIAYCVASHRVINPVREHHHVINQEDVRALVEYFHLCGERAIKGPLVPQVYDHCYSTSKCASYLKENLLWECHHTYCEDDSSHHERDWEEDSPVPPVRVD